MSFIYPKMSPPRGGWGCRTILAAKRHHSFPAPRKGGPASVFSEARHASPGALPVDLLLLSGDVEENPGPRTIWACELCTRNIHHSQTSIRCNHHTPHWIHLKCADITHTREYTNTYVCAIHKQTPNTINPTPLTTSQLPIAPRNQHTCTTRPQTQTHPTAPQDNETTLRILQININGVTNKIHELENTARQHKIDIILIQETWLTNKHKTPKITGYTGHRKDRETNQKGGGLLTYIKDNITHTPLNNPQDIDSTHIELLTTKIHFTKNKHLHVSNIYIPPRSSQTQDEDQHINACLAHVLTMQNSILAGDINAHSDLWYSPTQDHRGRVIADYLQNSEHLILNTDTRTRRPNNSLQQDTSPDITTIHNSLYNRAQWETLTKLNSDHLPILTTLHTRTKFRLTQGRRCYTNYRKANWTDFTEEIETALANTAPPTDVHNANTILTNIILQADKHNIPKGKVNDKHRLIPDDIRQKIDERNRRREIDPRDPTLSVLNDEIEKDLQKHKAKIWIDHVEKDWDYRTNARTFWSTLAGLNNKKNTHTNNITIDFNNKTATTHKEIATAFTKQFTNLSTPQQSPTSRRVIRKIHKLETTPITLTTADITKAIHDSKTNNSTGPDNINIQHLKHLGSAAINYLTKIYNIALNTNTIPSIWKLAKIIPIHKPNKPINVGTSYRPISLLSPIAKTLEKAILPYITDNIENKAEQHGFKKQHSTTTALHHINNTITSGFNKTRPPKRTVVVALDMSKAFDTVNITTLIDKVTRTNIPNTIKKFITNYTRGRSCYTLYANTKSKQRKIKAGVPQGGVLSPTLFNIYMADLPPPPTGATITTYADDITITSSDVNITKAQDNIRDYLQDIKTWTNVNNLQLNAEKTTTTLFTPDPAEYKTQLTLTIDNTRLPTVTHPKILGLTFDPKLTYNRQVANATQKANSRTKILKALTSSSWGKDKETLLVTYKALIRPHLEYGNTIYSPLITNTLYNNLQTVDNTAKRIITGCTTDTRTQHLHDETATLPIKEHFQLHASILRQKATGTTHPLHPLLRQPPPDRNMKETIFHNTDFTTNIDHTSATDDNIRQNNKDIHTSIVQQYLSSRQHNTLLMGHPPEIHGTERTLNRKTRRALAQLRANKSPLLNEYKHKISPSTQPTPYCTLCNTNTIHNTQHLFACPEVPTGLGVVDLWHRPVEVAGLLGAWGRAAGWTNWA